MHQVLTKTTIIMSLIEAIPTHMRMSLLEELQEWAELKEEIEERIDSREADLAHFRRCLETGAPLTPLNRAGNGANLRDNETDGESTPKKLKPKKQLKTPKL